MREEPLLGGKHSSYRSIPLGMLIYLGWRNISTKKLRSTLTITGIIIGIAAVFFLLSFGLGLRDIITKEVLGNQSVRSITVNTPNSKLIKLNAENSSRIGALPHVVEISSDFSFPGGIRYSGSEVEGIIYGIDTYYQDLTSLNLVEGRLMNKDDVHTALVNRSALKAMGIANEKSVIDQKVQLTIPLAAYGATEDKISDEFTIVGVIDSGTGTEVFIPRFNFEAVGVSLYSDVKLLADTTNNVQALRGQIESLGFQTSSPLDTIEQINQVFRFFNIILVGFGMIGMVVAILGMFNTLTISLLERTREIGLMISLGGRPKDMRRLFVIEAMILSIIGSVVGIIVALIVAYVINFVLFKFAEGRGVTEYFSLFATPWWLIVGTIAFMMIVGLLVVYFPARRAQRINPIEALRHE